MTAEVILRIVMICAGAAELLAVLQALVGMRMTEILCMFRGVFGLLRGRSG